LNGVRILLLEDDALISLDTEDMLLSLGALRVLVAHTIAAAEAILEREAVDAAVLDLVIGADRCEALAERLLSAAIPFVFASGFGDSASLPAALRGVPTVEKPYSSQALHAALLGVLDPS
jgi:response regulator RpfG family c-di-GMP phosphodiesterase